MLKHLTKIGPLLIITAAILWALDGIVRRSLFTLPPIVIVFFEHFIGTILLTPFIYNKFDKVKFSLKELSLLLLIALLSGVLGTLWFTTALLKVNFIPFSVVFLIQKLQPIFAVTTAVIFLKEKVSQRYLIWAFLAFVAAYFVTFKDGVVNFETGAGTIEAALFALGAAFAWGSSTTFSKIALSKNPSQIVTWTRFALTTLLSIPFIFFLNAWVPLFNVDSSQMLKFTFIALSTGMVALLIYYKGLKQTPVRVSTILELIFPVLAIVIDAYLYKTFLAPSQLIAAAILLFSIFRLSKLTIKNEV